RIFHVAQHFKTVHVRQLQIADRQMMSALIEELDSACSRWSDIYRVPFLDEVLAQRIGHHWLVIYYKNSHLFVFHLSLLSRNRRTLRGHQFSLLHKGFARGLCGSRKL